MFGKDQTPTKQRSILDFGYSSRRDQAGSSVFGRTQSAVLPSTTSKTLDPLSDDDDEFERTMLASLKSSSSKPLDHDPSRRTDTFSSSPLFVRQDHPINEQLDETDEDDELERAIQASLKDIRPTGSAPVSSSRTKIRSPLFRREKADIGALDEEDDSDNDDSFVSIGALTRPKSPSPIRARTKTLSPSLSTRLEFAKEKRSSPVPSPRMFQRAESARNNLLSSKWDRSGLEDDTGHGTRATSVDRTLREASVDLSRATRKRSLLFPGLNRDFAEDEVTSEEIQRQTARKGSSSRRWRMSAASVIDLTGDD